MANSEFDWPAKPSVLGTHINRLDGPDKVTGRAKYTFDINRPGMLYARMVRSPHPHARVVSVDLSTATRMPGVRTALLTRDFSDSQNNRVMFQGDEVAAVAADTEEHAIDAARSIKVEYDVLPHVTVVEKALDGTAPAVFTGGNVRDGRPAQAGDLTAGFGAAAKVVEETYSTQVITHNCMESHGTVCEWNGDRLMVWISTQGINAARENFASALGIPQANVKRVFRPTVLSPHSTPSRGARAGQAPPPTSRCLTFIRSRIATDPTRTFSPIPVNSGRCERQAIRRVHSTPRSSWMNWRTR